MNLNKFVSGLPGYFCLFEALELILLRSKTPNGLGLYSTSKSIAILLLLATGVIILRYISPVLSRYLEQIPLREKLIKLSPLKIFFVLAILFRLILINTPCSVGEDVAQQVLTTKQWIQGITSAPNLLCSPDSTNLSSNESIWLVRPPGVAWIALPGLLLGFSLGNSIHFTLFALYISMGAGWLKLARTFSLPMHCLQLLAFILAITVSLGSLSLSTASVITSATFPWLLIWSLYISDLSCLPKQNLKILLLSFLFFLAIGTHAFVKLSSLLTVAAIALIPFLIEFFKSRKIDCTVCIRAILAIILFFIPYFLLSSLNQHLTGISSAEVYSQQNFNSQHELWGQYFTESTQGGMLVTSFIASIGYATPIQNLAHGFRDLLLQFENYSSALHSHEINPQILGCCILSIPFTLLIFSGLWRIRKSLPEKELILYIILFVVPFLGFALVSYHHGYNYLIYHAYTKEFAIIFLIFSFCYIVHSRGIMKYNFIGNMLMIFFILFPTISYVKKYCLALFEQKNELFISQYEIQQDIGPSKFSKSLQLTSSDSNSSLDICLFLCAGDQGDLTLRTPMRSLTLHFAKGNLMHLPNYTTSHPLNVYCLFDPSLATDSAFVNSVIDKFPPSSISTQLDSMTWKVQL